MEQSIHPVVVDGGDQTSTWGGDFGIGGCCAQPTRGNGDEHGSEVRGSRQAGPVRHLPETLAHPVAGSIGADLGAMNDSVGGVGQVHRVLDGGRR